jgi:hypothetical protein
MMIEFLTSAQAEFEEIIARPVPTRHVSTDRQ